MKKKMTNKTNAGKARAASQMTWLLVATGFFLALDQLSKFLAIKYLEISLNEGVAFGMKLGRFFTIALTGVLIVVLLKVILNEFKLEKWFVKILSGMILGGAIGNLIDRIYLGHVIDFISIPYWPIFNLADVFIVVGVILSVLFYKKISTKPL